MALYKITRLKCLINSWTFREYKEKKDAMEERDLQLKVVRFVGMSLVALVLGIYSEFTYSQIHNSNLESANLPTQLAKAQAESDKAKEDHAKNKEYMDAEKAKAESSKAYFDSLPKIVNIR